MTRVWDLQLIDSDKIVLLALADCANDEGHCWPGMKSLSKKTSKSERTIQGCVQRLVEQGHLTRREVVGKGCNYTVHPRSDCAPADIAPPQGTTQTPAAAAGKPLITVNGSGTKVPSRARKKPKVDFNNGGLDTGEAVGWAVRVKGWTSGDAMHEWVRFHDDALAHDRQYSDWMAAWRKWCGSPLCKTTGKVPSISERRKEPLRV